MNSLNDFKLNYEPLQENKKYLRIIHRLPSKSRLRYRYFVRPVARHFCERFKDAVRRAGWIVESAVKSI